MDEPNIKPQYKLVASYYCGEALGNAEKAVIMAGYSKKYARGNANKLIARKEIQDYIAYLNSLTKDDVQYHIANIKEIQAFWTTVMQSGNYKTSDRLRASELLAKAQGAFNDDW